MSLGTTLLLGFIAGVTILIGIPLGRLRGTRPMLQLFLNALAIGVLLFLVWDVLAGAWEPLDARMVAVHDSSASIGPVLGYGLLFVGGLSVGLLGLVGYDRYLQKTAERSRQIGPGAASVHERSGFGIDVSHWSTARRLALLIAVGIGLHNFAEGLAIGQSAARNEVALATVLVIGFALHNATEGFGIVAPLAAEGERAPWGFLLTMALIGGGPTFVGTWIGHGFTSDQVSVVFLTLAAGSIVYVVCQLLGIASRARRMDVLALGILVGMVAGFATDAIVTMGGA